MRVFKEEQRFTQAWLIVLMVMSVLVPIGLIIKEYTSENSTMRTVEFVSILATIIGLTLPIFFFKLRTRIDEKGIHYRFFPFHRKFKTILWDEIATAHVRKYDAITEYGGWGFKGGFRRKKGRAINVSGDIGIQLELKNSKKILIGTQKETDAKKVIETYNYKLQETHEQAY
ncbi:hypothetical protein [Pseudotenacibaculum haliotis]|uniref:PH domain-containing protein n=1 Tax=Pseudotenacibaculum haliotis TaxID=1862138 RepID=A0ABW5LQ19_9FLAO